MQFWRELSAPAPIQKLERQIGAASPAGIRDVEVAMHTQEDQISRYGGMDIVNQLVMNGDRREAGGKRVD